VRFDIRFRRATAAVAIVILAFGPCRGQTAGTAQHASASDFASLATWKNAVLMGDSAGLRTLYSTSPMAEITASGEKMNVDADVDF